MDRIETEDWLPARREALASVLKGLPDPMLKADIEQRLGRWLPARLSYRASLIDAFGAWQPTARLQDVLFQAMHDEDRSVQRAAASAYASAFSPSQIACQRLVEGLARTRDLAAGAAFLETLAHGWVDVPEVVPLFEEAWLSHKGELNLIGILGLAEIGAATDEMRDAVLRGQSVWSDLSYPHRDLAGAMLMRYWPGDETLIKGALARATGHFGSIWELDVAMAYLLESPIEHADVRAWILAELANDFPFNVLSGGERTWSQVGRFAAADPEIRTAATVYWCEPKNRLINMHKIPHYVAQVADPPVAVALIETLADKGKGIDRYWALRALLTGWGRDHPTVKVAIDALANGDEDLDHLAALLPEILSDKAEARERLVDMGSRAEVRRDLLAIGLEACGCDAADNEAVAAILTFPEQLCGTFDPSYPLFRAFGAHTAVRAVALERAQEPDGPLAAIAAAYTDDPEVAPVLFDAAVPLPVELRTHVVEVAATAASGTALEVVLGQAMLETDPELRTRMLIAHLATLPPEAHGAARQTLIAKAVAVGMDFESTRAAALAGLATIGALDALATLEYRGKPVGLRTGGITKAIPSVERLVCERFAEFEAAFGDSLAERFDSGSGRRLAAILSAAPSASPAARAAFITLAERNEIPRTPHALRVLAAERPGSDLLLARCWGTLDSRDHGNGRAMVNADVGLILRDHFPGDAAVRQRLVKRFEEESVAANAILLAIFAPDPHSAHRGRDFS
jgi:hypothetical protein